MALAAPGSVDGYARHQREIAGEPAAITAIVGTELNDCTGVFEIGAPMLVTVARMNGAAPLCWPVDRRNPAE